MTQPKAGLTLCDRFTLRRRLGGGGMADVWLGVDPDGREVAVKILADHLADRPDMVRLFAHEAAQVPRLDHPGIARFLGQGEYEGRPFIVTRYIDGPDVASLSGRPAAELAAVFAGVADALAAAHRAGIIHRDLKPSNVLLGADGRPRLVDFGIAAALEDGPQVSGGGSGAFASPEQRAGAPPAVTDDSWGLGMLIRACLADADRDSPLAELADRLTDAVPASRGSDLARIRDELLALASPGEGPAPSAAGEALVAVRPEGLRRPAGPGGRPGPIPSRASPGPRRTALWASLAVLLVVLGVVVFLLPGWVAEQRAAAPPAAKPAPEPAEDPQEAIRRLVEQKRGADDVRSTLDAAVAALQARAVERWAAAEMDAIRAQVEAGQEAYARRNYEAAGAAWTEGVDEAETLTGRIPAVRDEALGAGDQALLAGDQAAALAAYSLAAAVDPDSEAARTGLVRAGNLDQVLAAMGEATEAESEGRFPAAREAYARAASLDPRWGPATEGVARMDAKLGDARFAEAMSRGYAALERGEFERARSAFESARQMRTGSSEARDALVQVESARRASAVQRLAGEAQAAEREERWADAVDAWQGVLAEDGSVAMAQEGLVRAQARAALDARMRGLLADPFRLTSADVARAARQAMADAEPAAPPRARLDQQVSELRHQLELAATPVRVVLESDGLTEVVLYRVGRLGTFSRRALELKPGRYTAVGSRPGYRDVRREFDVRPGQPMPGPVVIVSEEAI